MIIFFVDISELFTIIIVFPDQQIHENFLKWRYKRNCHDKYICLGVFQMQWRLVDSFYSNWPLNHNGGGNVKLVYIKIQFSSASIILTW